MAILTPDQRLRVFISSTLGELAPERAAVADVVRSLRLSPVMFEQGARPYPPRALYRAYLEQSHIFIGIYFQRYGWIAPEMEISGLEDEYRLAEAMPRLLYVKEPAPDREERLRALLDEVARSGTAQARTFATDDELAALVADDLALLLSERFSSARRPHDVDEAPAPAGGDLLPVSPTSFVGREREIADVVALLRRDGVRMVTLAGAGGVGKSRLALEVGRAVADQFPDGVHLVALAGVPDAGLVMANIATQLGVRTEERGAIERVVVEAIGERRLLLILDNFEHVVEAGPALGRLLESCANLHVLVTSRRLLRISAEHEYQVPPLALPSADDTARAERVAGVDAIRLFVERVTAVRPDFTMTDADAAAIAEICRRLDGVPLAIELAAARCRLLPPAALLARLEQSLDVLAGGLTDLPERQRSLRATLDWSASLLSESEQRLLARLSTFASGWTLEAAESVCGLTDDERAAVLDDLASLADNSLVVVDLRDGSVGVRFRLLQPVREYARERLVELGEADEIDRRHLEHFAALVEQAAPALVGRDQAAWLDRLEDETANLGAAASRAFAAGRADLLADMAWHLWAWLWLNHHVGEARHWLDPLLPSADDLEPLQRARLRWVSGSLRFEGGLFEEAAPLVDAALEEFTALGDEHGRGLALMIAGSMKRYFDDPEAARAYVGEATEILRRHGDRFSAAMAGGSLGMQWLSADAEKAEALISEAFADARAIRNDAIVAQLWLFSSFAALTRGNTDKANELLRRVVATSGGRRSDELVAYGFEGIGALALAAGDAATAARLLGAAAGLRSRRGMAVWPGMRAIVEGLIAGTRAALGDEEFESAWKEGTAMGRDEARRFALDVSERGAADSVTLD